ncbi:MAG: hypothetical protein J6A69_05695 [Clostridia bacterium]|nr:hypothetical protein [Clostridia bacterium]
MRKTENLIIYQIALRSFTPEGTIKAATKMLPHIKSLGVDVAYVCPFFVEDEDWDESVWSPRQRASETGNPKNPYKIADYYNIDEEYGTKEDLKEFADTAHSLGLLVMYDLVYLHCGRNAVFIKDNPDFVVCDEFGKPIVGETWPFARLNFENKELRKYLIKNMEMLIKEFDADGFRCDVGDGVPLDFWDEAFNELKPLNENLIKLNEGVDPEYIKSVFHMGYNFNYTKVMRGVFADGNSATDLINMYNEEKEKYGDNIPKLIRTIDTHDTASDCGLLRNEIVMTSKGVEAALVVNNTIDGVVFFWNGYEACDNAENNMFANRFYTKRSQVNWSRAFTEDGIRRMKFVKAIHKLHHENDAIVNGRMQWVENTSPDEIVSFIKISDKQKLLVVVNSKKKSVKAKVNIDLSGKILMKSDAEINASEISLKPYGYVIIEV